MARPYTAQELIPELTFWVKHPTDPSLRKLLRKTIQTLEAFKDLVGEPEIRDGSPEVASLLPDLPARIKEAE
jgi:hypothetical protein